ncbi:MAG: N-acyl-D-amino-acid deacylase [Parcubacteria group bacterium Gr01-1014_33]|nr:MAG: N-acyl-D-amino-acid deacylase [Parcubacteria group bacterium Gr01-1014_33]
MPYDLLIKSGTVIDGTGKPKFTGDIGVKKDRIENIGALGDSKGTRTIDATGKYVIPGCIDITNHSDTHLTLFRYPNLESMVMQGVTTIVGGNCGASLAPLASDQAIDAISKWADPRLINVNWRTFEEYLGEVQKQGPGVNFASFVGYGTLRRGVIGNDARMLLTDEREKVKYLLAESLHEGAFGLSLGLSYGHERVSSTEELIDVSRTVAHAKAVLKIHLRSEGKGLLASVNEVVRIARETGVSIQISHLKAIGKKSWPALALALELLETAKQSGLSIHFDVSPYRTTGSLLYLLIPPGARQGGFAELFKRIDNPEERTKIIEVLKDATIHYDRLRVSSAEVKNVVGLTIAEIAERAGLSPEEALLETVRANEGRVSIVGKTLSLQNLFLEVKNKNALIASDGIGTDQEALREGNVVHPRSFGTFPHFWHRFVGSTTGITPEEAVEKVSSGPAVKLGIKNRGFVRKGHIADIAVFDPKLIRDRATYKNPYRYPAGIDWVIINGRVAVEEGRFLGIRAGKVIRKT